jgi:hypothetical protein
VVPCLDRWEHVRLKLFLKPLEWRDGDQTRRLSTLGQRSCRLVYRYCAYRPPFSSTRPSVCCWRQRHIRGWSAYRLAYPSPGTDTDRHGRLRMGSAGGWRDRGDSSRRCGLVRAGRETLARGYTDHGYDSHRSSGTIRWQGRGLDGARQRRAIPTVNPDSK